MNSSQFGAAGRSEHATLKQTLDLLGEVGVRPLEATFLDAGLAALGDSLQRTVVAEVPAFSVSGNPEILPELARHAAAHIGEIRRLFLGGGIGSFDFVRAHAQRRAEQRFPLEATLHAYRCGHKVLSHWMRDAALAARPVHVERAVSAVADFAIEYTNTISTILAGEYVAHTRMLAEAEGDRRTELLNALVSGYDESDGRVTQLLRGAGYLEQRQTFCVAVARSTDPLEMKSPARAQRIAASMSKAVARLPIRTLIGLRNDVVTGVFAGTRRLSGWTAPQSDLADQLHSALLVLGPAVLIGVSSDQPSTAFIPRALHEADVALDFASVTQRVVRFCDLPLRRLLLHRGRDYVQPALPAWLPGLLRADAKMRGALITTLQSYADSDMNVQEAARILAVHPNTLYARLRRIHELTGLDGQRYHDLTELLLAVECGGSRASAS